MQLTFGDAEGLGKRKQTRREIFLAEMEQPFRGSNCLP
ncbi:transposase [Xanthomonas axonopodis pv. vasculorum]|uniref:Transposase n=1 Tax=Xanthomonas axonopodis pv. vasculorum TaxID=325777 RepID=A0A098Q0I4_9XANT|nr:transposase [Xanthomonas axonopodis pv. vasculorum]